MKYTKISTFLLITLTIGLFCIPQAFAAIQDQHNQLQNLDLEWHNGAINQINSDYTEGDVVPYRYELVGLPGDAYIHLTITYRFTKGGKYAFDFLANYDQTEGTSITSSGGPFGDSTPLSSLIEPDITETLQIPDDGSISTDDSFVPQYFDLGGDIADLEVVSGPILTGDTSGDSEKEINLKITTTTGDDLQIVLFWGGHLAIGDGQDNWPLEMGSSSISGAPYHQSVSGYVDENKNNQKDPTEKNIGPGDRAIQNVGPSFVIPEIPFGTVVALMGFFTGLGAFYYTKKHRIKQHTIKY